MVRPRRMGDKVDLVASCLVVLRLRPRVTEDERATGVLRFGRYWVKAADGGSK